MSIYDIHESTISIHAPVLSELKAIDRCFDMSQKTWGRLLLALIFDSILINYAKWVIYKNSSEEQLQIII